MRISLDLGGTLGQSRGTGFAVSKDGLILTAFHVIEGKSKGKVHTGPITLRFGTPAAPRTFTVDASHVVHFSVADDWAVLRCSGLPPEVEPLRLEERRLADEPEWVTFGFPQTNPDAGEHYGGVIRGTGSPIILHGTDVRESRIPGISGSPCMVNASVVGLITETGPVRRGPNGEVLAATGALYVVPIALVAAACTQLELHRDLPFQQEVFDLLGPLSSSQLDLSVADLKLPGVATLAELPKRERVAEAMLRGGVATAFAGMRRVCRGLQPDGAANILDFAATIWVEPQAIHWLEEQVLHQPLRPIALNTSLPDTGRWSLHRAGYKTAGSPGWITLYIRLTCTPGELSPGPALIAQIRKELADIFPGGIGEGLQLQREIRCPAFALIQGEPPPVADALFEVQKAFPDLVLLVLVSPAAQPEFLQGYQDAGIVVVDPLLDAGREQQEFESYHKLSNALALTFKALKKPMNR